MSKKRGLFAQTFTAFGRHKRACLTGIGAGVLVQVLFAVLGVCRPVLPDWMQVIRDGFGKALPGLPQLLYWGTRFVVTTAVSTLISLLMLHKIFTEEFADAMGTMEYLRYHVWHIAGLMLQSVLIPLGLTAVFYFILRADRGGYHDRHMVLAAALFGGAAILFSVYCLPRSIAKTAAFQLERWLIKADDADAARLGAEYCFCLAPVLAGMVLSLEHSMLLHLVCSVLFVMVHVLFHLAWYRMILPEEYVMSIDHQS